MPLRSETIQPLECRIESCKSRFNWWILSSDSIDFNKFVSRKFWDRKFKIPPRQPNSRKKARNPAIIAPTEVPITHQKNYQKDVYDDDM